MPEFHNLDTIDIWGWKILCPIVVVGYEAAVSIVACLVVSVVSTN